MPNTASIRGFAGELVKPGDDTYDDHRVPDLAMAGTRWSIDGRP
jgi:hypothetical protein